MIYTRILDDTSPWSEAATLHQIKAMRQSDQSVKDSVIQQKTGSVKGWP
jgi:hypothetical protein